MGGLFRVSPSAYGTDEVHSKLRFDDHVLSGVVVRPVNGLTNLTCTTESDEPLFPFSKKNLVSRRCSNISRGWPKRPRRKTQVVYEGRPE